MKSSFSDMAGRLIFQIEEMNRETMKSVLTFGEMSMSESQFRAFRRIVLNLYGANGLQRKVRDVVSRTLGVRMARAGVPVGKGQTDGEEAVSMR